MLRTSTVSLGWSDLGTNETLLEDLYGLTPREAELALLLMAGLTLEEAARSTLLKRVTALVSFRTGIPILLFLKASLHAQLRNLIGRPRRRGTAVRSADSARAALSCFWATSTADGWTYAVLTEGTHESGAAAGAAAALAAALVPFVDADDDPY